MNRNCTCSLIILLVLWLALYGTGLAGGSDVIWSTYFGARDTDESFALAVDDSGYIYMTGFVGSIDFPTTTGAFDTTHNGGTLDAFVVKLDPKGKTVVYSTFLGGDGPDQGYGIAVDNYGSAYVTGRTRSTDFPVTCSVFDTTANGHYDVFAAKLNSTGTSLLYATFLGGSRYDHAEDIALDVYGNAYLSGWTMSEDFPTTRGAFGTIFLGEKEEDAFVAKLSPAGRRLVYSSYLGGTDEDWCRAIAVDDSGNAYLGGLTYSVDFPTTNGAFDQRHNGTRDAWVAKLNPKGRKLVYSTLLGGSALDWIQDIVVDGAGNTFMAGVTSSPDFPATAKGFDDTHNGSFDGFLAELNSTGSALVFATFLGEIGEERSTCLGLDGSGNIYVVGWTQSEDFPTTAKAFDTSYNGGTDTFLAKFDPLGSVLLYGTFLGGDSTDVCPGFAVDASGIAYLSGWTESKNFPTTAGALDTKYGGKEDIFVTKLDLSD